MSNSSFLEGGAFVSKFTSLQGRTLAVACAGTFMLMLDVTAVTIALTQIGKTFDAEFSDLQWVVDAYTLTLAVFLLPMGFLADRYGRKRVFNAGLLVFTLSSLVLGLASNILTLQIFRAVQGVGGAVMYAVGPALIGHAIRGPSRDVAFGIFGSIAGLAIAIGPLLGGALTSGQDWRWIFLINVPIGILTLVAGAASVEESHHPRSERLDLAGFATFSLGLGLVVTALLRSGGEGGSPRILAAFAVGIVLLAAFLVIEWRRGRSAMFDLSLFRIPSFTGIAIATFLSNAAIIPVIVFQLFYMQNVLGYSAWETGLRFIPQTFTAFIFAMVTGAVLMNKLSPGALVGSSIAFIAAGIGVAAIMEPGSSWTLLLPSLLLTGIGMGLFNPPRATVTIGVVPPEQAGTASGMGECFQQVGVAIGIAAFGAYFDHRVATAFASSEAGQRLGEAATAVGHAIVVDGPAQVAAALPPELGPATARSAEAAFLTGFNEVMLLSALVCLTGAVLAALTIRVRDLHHASGAAPAPAVEPGSLTAAGQASD